MCRKVSTSRLRSEAAEETAARRGRLGSGYRERVGRNLLLGIGPAGAFPSACAGKSLLPGSDRRQPKKPPLEGAVWAADTENELEETYFWASDQQALFLQHVPESLYFQAPIGGSRRNRR